MGKGDKKHRARRKQATGLPELAATPKRQPNGQHRTRADNPTDPRKTALQARCRHFGGKDTKEGRAAMSGQHSGSQIGMVMQASLPEKKIGPLWQTFQAWTTAEETYRRRYLGQSEHARSPAMAMTPEPMQTDTSHSVDLRDADQKDQDAINNWMRWQGYLGHLSSYEQTALHDARLDRVELWRDQNATLRGMASLAALQALHRVVSGR